MCTENHKENENAPNYLTDFTVFFEMELAL